MGKLTIGYYNSSNTKYTLTCINLQFSASSLLVLQPISAREDAWRLGLADLQTSAISMSNSIALRY